VLKNVFFNLRRHLHLEIQMQISFIEALNSGMKVQGKFNLVKIGRYLCLEVVGASSTKERR
jgi:hypothetical protein